MALNRQESYAPSNSPKTYFAPSKRLLEINPDLTLMVRVLTFAFVGLLKKATPLFLHLLLLPKRLDLLSLWEKEKSVPQAKLTLAKEVLGIAKALHDNYLLHEE